MLIGQAIDIIRKNGCFVDMDGCSSDIFSVEDSIGQMTKEQIEGMFPGYKIANPNGSVIHIPATLCHSLPSINKRGRCFTQQVLARSSASAIDSLVNMEHQLSHNGRPGGDVIIGHIAASAMSEIQNTDIASVNASTPLNVLLAIYARAEAASEIIASPGKWRTSMECHHDISQAMLYYEDKLIPIEEASEEMIGCIHKSSVSPYKGKKLGLALGGLNGSVNFWGIAMTKTPADSDSKIYGIIGAKPRREIASASSSDSKRNFFIFRTVHEEIKEKEDFSFNEVASVDNQLSRFSNSDISSIEVIGETEPAEDGHTHEILSDGTVMPKNGHSHYTVNFSLERGANPAFTGRTSEESAWKKDPQGNETRVTHLHMFSISLKGKAKKASAAVPVDSSEALASINKEATMDEISEILKKMLKFLDSHEVASKPDAVTAGLASDIRNSLASNQLASMVQKEIANQIQAGTLLTKESSEKLVEDAIKAQEQEYKKKEEEQKIIASRIAKFTETGASLNATMHGTDKTYEAFINSIPTTPDGDALFETVMSAVNLAKTVHQAATTGQTQAATSEVASAAKKPKIVPLFGSSSEMASQQDKGGSSDGTIPSGVIGVRAFGKKAFKTPSA